MTIATEKSSVGDYALLFVLSIIVSAIVAYFYFGFSLYVHRYNAIVSVEVAVQKVISKEEIKNWEYLKNLLFISVVLISSLLVWCAKLKLSIKGNKILDVTIAIVSVVIPILFIIVHEFFNLLTNI